ncbi:hypothetical protein BDQ17DRAFT_460559 [Cyathus striatus]|nr:hypothetical protein BDQ17DRAFT_460559 [Cyathus striatus]
MYTLPASYASPTYLRAGPVHTREAYSVSFDSTTASSHARLGNAILSHVPPLLSMKARITRLVQEQAAFLYISLHSTTSSIRLLHLIRHLNHHSVPSSQSYLPIGFRRAGRDGSVQHRTAEISRICVYSCPVKFQPSPLKSHYIRKKTFSVTFVFERRTISTAALLSCSARSRGALRLTHGRMQVTDTNDSHISR